ncbi:iron-sulfur cluster biosynthesis family protein [Salimicrobium flavidum]|uniref:Uncharacterized protein YqkB n=1 Tax=Salimicrobium flavidum TaxID=570947 RepID=A0A1N7IIU3_9BACI|nr:iron-sulfur cluster biosynthesis family protein [Salimicrobium flavidum]SIS37005.1 Uncharacterized protein YqkB [Salimicrobium flavidum]
MRIDFSEDAKTKIHDLLKRNNETMLRLAYDTDDCGCGVNGVPVIRLESGMSDKDMKVANDDFFVVINREQSLFFKENMKVELFKGAFRLKSDQGILNPMISPRQVCEKEGIS